MARKRSNEIGRTDREGGWNAGREVKVASSSCGCMFCDLKIALYRDDDGFYHDGPEDTRIRCEVSHENEGNEAT
jgi:hypothetical protein